MLPFNLWGIESSNLLMINELNDVYASAEGDLDVWTIIVTGAGRAFCAGADVDEVPADGRVPHEGQYLSRYREWEAPQEATPPFRTMAKPIIVAVNGLCCGAGMDLVTTGDISVSRRTRPSSTRM
jgi:enoyl-CoA hydratase/carnithine racemase